MQIMQQRVILHSDMNNFYASVECLDNPDLRGKPMAVTGDPAAHHGIVLAKNYEAKNYGITTGEPLWMAMQKCPDIIFTPPRYDRYIQFSQAARQIYEEYTDRVESFGLDECWMDVSESTNLFGNGKTIADEIRTRIKQELGITASVSVSYNKIFAKLGSDLKKPDATTDIKITLYILSESVAERMRMEHFYCRSVQISIWDNTLASYERQGRLPIPTCTSQMIFEKAFELYQRNRPAKPARSLGVRACKLSYMEYRQLSFLENAASNQRQEELERCIDKIRQRYGHYSIQRGIMLMDKNLSCLDPISEHTIYPEAFLKGQTIQ